VDWPLINSFAGWVSGIGTLLAVIVSLYLARQDSRIRLKLSAGLRQVFTTGPAPPEGRDFIVISVTNIGRRAASVTGLFWKSMLVRNFYAMQNPGRAPLSAQLPIRLQDGEGADFTIALRDFISNDRAAFLRMLPRPRSFTARFLRVHVRTSTGKVFRVRIEQDLGQWLMEYVEGKAKTEIE